MFKIAFRKLIGKILVSFLIILQLFEGLFLSASPIYAAPRRIPVPTPTLQASPTPSPIPSPTPTPLPSPTPVATLVCTPNCTSLVCGPDGCGGTCGSCAVGYSCAANQQSCLGPSPTPVSTIAAGTTILAVNAGGALAGSFLPDSNFTGGAGTYSTTASIDTSGVTNPAPQGVYQTERWGGGLTYTLPGLTPGGSYTVRLHFAEIFFTAVNQRKFNVDINGTRVLTEYDIIAAAGAANKAVVPQFPATANSLGQIVVTLTNGTLDNAKINGIEITQAAVVTPTLAPSPLTSPVPSPSSARPYINSSYSYDNAGNITGITDNTDASKTLGFTYDNVYRLTGASGGYSASYQYDVSGNILSKTEGSSVVNETYTNTGTTAVHAPKTVNGQTLTYDGNGNLTADANANLSLNYNFDNRPVSVTSTIGSTPTLTKYYYDGEGKRVKKEVYDNTNPASPVLKSTTYYINQYFEKEIPVGGTPIVRKFYPGVGYRENGVLTYTASDHLSSTTTLTDSNGNKINSFRYYPYGQPLTTTSLPPNSWIGQKLDTESNLYFLNARYYSPLTGRFVQADEVADPGGRGNQYGYASNNPIGLSDPSGKCPICVYAAWAFMGIAFGGIIYADGIAPNQQYQSAYVQEFRTGSPAIPKIFGKNTGFDFTTARQRGYDVEGVGIFGATVASGLYDVGVPWYQSKQTRKFYEAPSISTYNARSVAQKHVNAGLDLIKEEKYNEAIAHFRNANVLGKAGYNLENPNVASVPSNTPEAELDRLYYYVGMHSRVKRDEITGYGGTVDIAQVVFSDAPYAPLPTKLARELALGSAEEWTHVLQNLTQGGSLTGYVGGGGVMEPDYEMDVARYFQNYGVPLEGTVWYSTYRRNVWLGQ